MKFITCVLVNTDNNRARIRVGCEIWLWRVVSLLTLWLTIPSVLPAEQIWEQPLELFSHRNINYQGKGYQSSDGSYFLIWNDLIDGVYGTRYQYYSQSHQAIWDTHHTLEAEFKCMTETSDGCFVIIAAFPSVYGNDILLAAKINTSGNFVWPDQYKHINYTADQCECVPDNDGGLFYYLSDEGSLGVNHIDTNGVKTLANDVFIGSSNCYYPNMIILPNQNIIISYRRNFECRLISYNLTMTQQWQHTVSDNIQVMQVDLVSCSDGFFEVVYSGSNSLKAQRFDGLGQPQWAIPVLLTDSTADYFYSDAVHWQNSKTMVVFTNGLHIYLRSLDELGNIGLAESECFIDGVSLTDYIAKPSLHLSSSDSLYLFVNVYDQDSNAKRFYGQYLSESGFVLENEVLLVSVPEGGYWYYSPFTTCIGEDLHTFYFESGNGSSAINYISMNISGITQDSPISVLHGTCGAADNPVLCQLGNNILVAWFERTDYSGSNISTGRIRYQVVNPQGLALLAIPGTIPANGTLIKVKELHSIAMENGSAVLVWYEDSPKRIVAQQIDNIGNLDWGPTGLVAYEGSTLYQTTLSVFTENNSVLIYWQRGTSSNPSLAFQRITNGQIQWGTNGKILLNRSSVPAEGDFQFEVIGKDYTIFQIYGELAQTKIGLLQFNSDGDPLSGYQAWGKFICPWEAPYLGVYFRDCLDTPAGLFVHYALVFDEYWFQGQHYTDYYVYRQLFNAFGDPLAGDYGWLTTDSDYFLAAEETGFYLYTGYVLQKYDYSSNLLWDAEFSVYPKDLVGICSPGDNYLGLAQDVSSNSLRYFGFNTTGAVHLLGDSYLDQTGEMILPSLAEVNGFGYALWGRHSKEYYNTTAVLYLQKLSVGIPPENPDPPAYALLTQNYPNPFSGSTQIRVLSNQQISCSLSIYNLRGQLVKKLFEGVCTFGENLIEWDGTDSHNQHVAPGVYFARLSSVKATKAISKLLKID